MLDSPFSLHMFDYGIGLEPVGSVHFRAPAGPWRAGADERGAARAADAKITLKGGTSLVCTFFILCAYKFFPGVDPSPKVVFFNPNMGTGLKTPTFGGPTCTPKKLYAHKMGQGGPPILPLGWFWGEIGLAAPSAARPISPKNHGPTRFFWGSPDFCWARPI